jgi:hypothetical protein
VQKIGLATILSVAVLSAGSVQAGMGTKVSSRYDPVEVAGLARSGLPTVILGQAGQGVEASVVKDLLRPPGWLGSASFDAAAPNTPGARLVIIFNPSDPAAAKRDVCGDVAALDLDEPGQRLVIRAAYCIGNEMVTRVTAVERPIKGPDDPRFSKLLRQVVSQLFPRTGRSQFDSPGI